MTKLTITKNGKTSIAMIAGFGNKWMVRLNGVVLDESTNSKKSAIALAIAKA